jgi:hypothetical protein
VIDFRTVKLLFGASPNSVNALDSHISLLANTLLSLTGSNPLPFSTGSLEGSFELSTGGGLGDFPNPLVSHLMGVEPLMDPQCEEAFVLVDLRDAPEMEDVSETGEESPDEDSLKTDGLVGRVEDSEIQWGSKGSLLYPDQSEVEVSWGRGAWDDRDLMVML